MPCGASVSGASGPPGLAATGMMGAPRNLEQKDKSPHGHRRARREASALTPSKAPRGAVALFSHLADQVVEARRECLALNKRS